MRTEPWIVLAALSCTGLAVADDRAPARLEEIVVYGRAEQLVGIARAASEGLVGYDDIQLPPLLRVGELAESVPGMVATQHSGTGKANQYFLRGFNLDHGTDFAASAEGVPLNMRSHGHGQGYLDLNFLIPELVATATYRKGPYSAASGDFSSAGGVDFRFYDRLPDNLLSLTAGQNRYGRALLAGSADLGDGAATGAADFTRYDGPWAREENLRQDKLHLSYQFPAADGTARLMLQGYEGRWDATDQIPERAVEAGVIEELGFIDPDLGGETGRYALSAGLDRGPWRINAFAVDYQFALFSNFTYLLDDPERGDEFEQRDRRTVYGFALGAEHAATEAATLRWGTQLRYDDVREVGLFNTVARRRTGTIRDDRLQELSAGIFAEAELALTERWRGIIGLRGDHFDWDVHAALPANSGSGDDQLLSPSLALAFRPAHDVELYASWGRGFHSNDVRGATIAVDPLSRQTAQPVDVLTESEGAELGVRLEAGQRFNATLVGFWLELDSELLYVGDAGTTEAQGASRRRGIEATAFWQPGDAVALNATYTYTDARFLDAPGGAEIPGAVASTFALGINAQWGGGLSASARLRYLGEAPLVEDGSVRSDDSVLINAGLALERGRTEWRLDAFNLLDSDSADIAYHYASRLPGEPAEGVEDVHFHPLEPRSLRGTLTLRW